MPPKNKTLRWIRFKLEWALAYPVLLACRLLPRRLAILLLMPWVFLFWVVDRKHKRSILDNISLAYPEKTKKEVKDLAWRSYAHLARAVVDFCTMHRITKENYQERIRFENIELFDEAVAQGKGLVVITGHFGLWEISGHATHLHRPDFTTIGRHMDNPHVHNFVFRQRQSGGMTCLLKLHSIFPLFKLLKKGGKIAALMDQDGGRDGAYLRLFGQLCSTHISMIQLARKTGAPLIAGSGFYEDDGYHYCIRFDPIEPLSAEEATDDEEINVLRQAQKMNNAIEAIVRRHPEQWLWMHRRFRRKPAVGCRILTETGDVLVHTKDGDFPLDERRRRESQKDTVDK